jgi:CheY-like chemotaxis protein
LSRTTQSSRSTFEDTVLGFGAKTVRTAASVTKALEMIADRAPDFALLDVGLVHEKSFAIAERLDALKIPFVFVTGYGSAGAFPAAFAHTPTRRRCRNPVRPRRCGPC